MKIHSKNFTRKFLKFSLIGIIFFLSCGKGEVQQGETVEWYTKLGFKEVAKQMKKDTQLLTRKLAEGDWDDAELLCAEIGKSFNKLNLDSPDIPEEFFELKQRFDKALAKLVLICRDKESDKVDAQLEAVKKSCSYCHRVLRKDLDRMNMETDFDVALERVYKDRKTDND
ncbi:MAG: Cytochrome C' [Candidatus Scalindua rubra]|uniref:Cytochrome C n=1 Tax=Candidatus Scalindua rubra TaxID=1872076 RepID=A0A1E3X6B2_9BACT|nr:MAG: Cytochrome C' [Candidatus Scalindua rubra]